MHFLKLVLNVGTLRLPLVEMDEQEKIEFDDIWNEYMKNK